MRNARIATMILVLTAAGLACALPGGPKPPASPIPVSTEAAGQLEDTMKTAVADAAKSGQLNVTITEEQITSYTALKLAEQPDPPFTDPQIYLRDGKMQIFGTAKAGNVTAQARIVVSASVNAEGRLDLAIEEADFGPIPVPDSLRESLSSALDEALTAQAGGDTLTLTGVTIADGQMTLTGTVAK